MSICVAAPREGERFPKENVGGGLPRCPFGRDGLRSWLAWVEGAGRRADVAGKREVGDLPCIRPRVVAAVEPRTIHLRVARVRGKESRGKLGRHSVSLSLWPPSRNFAMAGKGITSNTYY